MSRFLVLLLGVTGLTGCALQTADAVGDSQEDLSKSFVYRCSESANKSNVWWLKVGKTKLVMNQAGRTFTASSGAETLVRDNDYVSSGKYPRVRYWKDEDRAYVEWKLEPEMVTGGVKMRNGDLGGFAVMGNKGDWYASSSYICFRD